MPRQQNVVYVRKERGEGLARGLKGPFSSSSFSPFSLIERNNGPILEGRREAEKILILVAKLLPPQHNTFLLPSYFSGWDQFHAPSRLRKSAQIREPSEYPRRFLSSRSMLQYCKDFRGIRISMISKIPWWWSIVGQTPEPLRGKCKNKLEGGQSFAKFA